MTDLRKLNSGGGDVLALRLGALALNVLFTGIGVSYNAGVERSTWCSMAMSMGGIILGSVLHSAIINRRLAALTATPPAEQEGKGPK